MMKRIAVLTLCFCVLFQLAGFAVITDQENNLALNKPSYVDNMIDGYPASNVNDGNTASFWTGGSTVDYAGAAYGLKSGWQVDLEAEYKISTIILYLRDDVDQGTRQKFDVRLSNDPMFGESEVVYVDTSATELPRGTVITINVTSPETYRYVRVARTDAGYFALSEVMVFGEEAGAGDSGFHYENYEKALHLLGYLGVFQVQDFEPNRLLSRAEALDKILRLCKLSNVTEANTQTFTDVPPDNPYYSAVEFAAATGIISGDGTGRFMPNERVTASQFAKMLLFALNYDYIASIDGYYSIEVMKAADRYDLFKGMQISADYFLNSEQAAIILYNALQMPVISGTFNGQQFTYESRDIDVLKSYYDLTEYRGIITATPYSSLEMAQKQAANYIQISGKDYVDNTLTMHGFLGQSVDYFVSSQDESLVELFIPTTRNQMVPIEGRDIEKAKSSLSSRNLSVEGGENYSLTEGYYVIYNGIADLDYTLDTFCGPYVELRLLDNNNDGEYEIVFIDDYTTVLVKNIGERDGIITVIGEDGQEFSLNGDSKWGNVQTFGGVAVPAENVESGDVLTGTISKNGEVYNLTAGQNEISGMVEEVLNEGSYLEIRIDGQTYEVHQYYETLLDAGSKYASEIKPGTEYQFVADTKDRIVALADKNSGSQWQYAFLLAIDKGQGVESKPVLRVLCVDSTVKDYKPADQLDLDGREIDSDNLEAEINAGLLAPGMIKMKLRGETISAIRTTNSGNGTVTSDTLNETPCEEGLYYLARLNCLYYLNYRMEAHTNPNSPVFYVATNPDGSLAANEIDSMRVEPINSIRDWDATYFEAYYDKDPEDKTPGAYLRYVQVGSAIEPVDEMSPIALVDKVNRYIDPEDEDEETLYRLTGFNTSGEFQMPFEPGIYATSDITSTPEDLQQGDMIVYEEDNGRIVAYDVLYRISRDKNAVEDMTEEGREGPFYVFSDALINQMTGRQRLNYGVLLNKTSSLISVVDRIPGQVDQATLEDRTEVYNIPTNLFIYSEKEQKIRKAGSNDLDKIIYDNNPNGRIMVYTHEGYMQYVVAFDFE